MERRDYTSEAEALFARFAARHGLAYDVENDGTLDVCWTFPEQSKLSMPLTLGLQNCDELNFGVSDFWSYFYPFDSVAQEFEAAIDAWVRGDARIAVERGRGRKLQLWDGDRWKTIYGANGCLLPISSKPIHFQTNRPTD